MKLAESNGPSRRADWWRTTGIMLWCIGGLMLVGGCSTMEDIGDATADGASAVADAVNPFNWFGDNKDEQKAQKQEPAPTTDPVTGSRNTVEGRRQAQRKWGRHSQPPTAPKQPKEATSSQPRQEPATLREGLVGDTQNAQYSDHVLRAPQPDAARTNDRIKPSAPPVVPASPAPSASQPNAGGPVMAAPVVAPPPAARRSAARQAPAPPQPAPLSPPAPSALPTVPPAPPSVQAPGSVPQLPQTAARQPAPAAPPAPRSVLKSIQVATIHFPDGSARLSAADRQVVRQVAEMARRAGGRLRIIGHSSVGDPAAVPAQQRTVNYEVSLDRANAVAAELLRLGMPRNRLQVSAEGDRNPIYAESSPTGAAGNRRAEIYMEFIDRS